MTKSLLDDIVRELVLRLGAESANLAVIMPNGDRLGVNCVRLPEDAPKLRAMAFRALAQHLRHCAKRAELAAQQYEKKAVH